MNIRATALGVVLTLIVLPAATGTARLALAQPVDPTMPSLAGAWVVKDVRFGNGGTGYQVVPPDQKQQLLRRVGATLQVAATCGQGGPAPKQDRELIPHSEFERPTSGQTKRLVSLGIGSRGQGVWAISRMCGNAMAGSYYWAPGTAQIVGGHNVNDMLDYEYVLERVSAAGATGANQAPLKDLGQLSGIWVRVADFPQGCAPSPAWIAASDQAMKIDAKAIQRFEWQCAVTGVAPAPDSGLRVNARCGFAGADENVTINMSLAQGRLTLREKTETKTYAKCQR